jgi:hypothetical protein
VSAKLAAWESPVLADRGGGGDGGSAKPSSCSLVLVLSLTSMAALLHPLLPGWLSDALLWGAGGVSLRSSSPAAWGGLLRSPRPDRMGVGHPLRCFTASSAPTRSVTPSGRFPGGDSAAVVCRSPSAARWTPEGPDHASALFLGFFLYFCGAVL